MPCQRLIAFYSASPRQMTRLCCARQPRLCSSRAKKFASVGVSQRWLELLTALRPELNGAARDLDHAMSRLLSDPANTSVVVSTLGHGLVVTARESPSTQTPPSFSMTRHGSYSRWKSAG